MILYLDSETFSETPIKHGLYRYAETVEVMLVTYAIDDGEAQCWDRTADHNMPADLEAALLVADIIVIHNSQFDRRVMLVSMGEDIDLGLVFDTMACALSHGLPGALGLLCDIMGVPTDKAKDKAGKQLINLFCKPTKKGVRNTRESHPEKWLAFIDYAKLDIVAMREVYKRLPRWNYPAIERHVFELDQLVNARGVAVDVELANAAVSAVASAQQVLAVRAQELTDNAVQSATQRDAMIAHILAEYGVTLPDMQGATLERRISDPDLPDGLKELLAVRLQATTSSTAKYKALINAVSSDGRLRGTLQYCGASRTGRWSGRLFQPQNLPRPTFKQDRIDDAIDALKAGCADLVIENVMEAASNVIRGCLVAAPGRKLVVADLSNIEGRVLAWLAGEEWKLQAFRDYDAGIGADLYKLAYAKSFGVKPEAVSKDDRQIGKVQELALGYEGGVGAFVTFAVTYGIDLDDMAAKAFDTLPAMTVAESRRSWEWAVKQKRTFGMTDTTFIVCDAFKRLWRAAHPNVCQLWADLDAAVRAVIEDRSLARRAGKLTVCAEKAWLKIILPSGRAVCYPSPRIENGKITYMGTNQYSRKWERLSTYGGKLAENVTQAAARDVLADGMLAAEAAGYEVVLSVHDELLTETPDTPEFTAEGLAAHMTAANGWNAGLPLSAAGFETHRYRKD